FKDPTSGTMLVELRSTGVQTVLPGSTHTSGERIEWVRDGEPGVVDAAILRQQVAGIALTALLGRHWPHAGARHEVSLAVAGGLLQAGWSDDSVEGLLHAVAAIAGDEELTDRVASVRTTRARLGRGEQVTGWATLEQLIDKRVVDA